MDLFWEIHQSQRIADARTAGKRGEEKAEDVARLVRDLEERLNQLTLVNMAIWSLVQERTGLTDQDLVQRIQEIDLSDGQLDGKVRTQIQTCPHCQRTLSQKHNRCLFCGYEPENPDVFRSVMR